ncbi:MAG: hypothetical protein QOJ16_4639 [Acidobacteriota bacterium]|nr:hypothetical protein [Acidobacteriota bacterium]
MQFMHGFTQEITSLQILAMRRGLPGAERPVRAGGLVPSADGCRWTGPDRRRAQPAARSPGCA